MFGPWTRVFVLTVAPPSLQMRVSALSRGLLSLVRVLTEHMPHSGRQGGQHRDGTGKNVQRVAQYGEGRSEKKLRSHKNMDLQKKLDQRYRTSCHGKVQSRSPGPNDGTQQTGEAQCPACTNLVCALFLGSTETSNKSDHGLKMPATAEQK